MSLYLQAKRLLAEEGKSAPLVPCAGARVSKLPPPLSLIEEVQTSLELPQGTVGALCPHVADPELQRWYADHPEVVCARCWLEGHPTRGSRLGGAAS
jgi:hypothetical protein